MSAGPKAPTLAELLERQADERGAAVAYRFLPDGDNEGRLLTFAGLFREARAIAAHLQRVTARGDRALILVSDATDFIRSFLACQVAGVIAVPVYPPLPLTSKHKISTLRAIAADSGAVVVLSSREVDFRKAFAQTAPELVALHWVLTDDVSRADADEFTPVEVTPQDISFLQYTSGSTSLPKGAVITHDAIMHNEEFIRQAGDYTTESVIVSWLPLFHDMGLIGTVLPALYAGCTAILMPPLAFVQRPIRWLRAIAKYRATVSGGPNFGYDLCVRRTTAEQRAGLDLSSWKIAFSGAEPIRAATLDAFAEMFGPHGFRAEAFYPCYGLAECTLMATATPIGAGATVLDVDLEALQQGRLVLGGDHRLVVSGSPRLYRRLEIVDPETRKALPEGEVGEIWLGGPDVARGYWNNPEESERTFAARTAGDDDGPFLRTGDLGVLHEGGLVVTGRMKDLIIIEGRNHYPQDIESTVESAHPGVRQGNVIAFAVDRDGRERLVVVAELDPRSGGTDPEQLRRSVRAAVTAQHGVPVEEIVLIAPGQVPKTSSGKVQRRAARALLERGEFTLARRSQGDR